jgi:hypothetical protein
VKEGLQNAKLTPEHAAKFMKNAKGLALDGRSAIVRQVIADRANGRI